MSNNSLSCKRVFLCCKVALKVYTWFIDVCFDKNINRLMFWLLHYSLNSFSCLLTRNLFLIWISILEHTSQKARWYSTQWLNAISIFRYYCTWLLGGFIYVKMMWSICDIWLFVPLFMNQLSSSSSSIRFIIDNDVDIMCA